MVSLCAEHNTKLVRYMLMHHTICIMHPCNHADITLDAVHAFAKMCDYELNYENPKTKLTIDDKDWPKTFEALEQYFTLKHGEYHIPLANVIWEQVDLPTAADDPADNYAMPVEEMIAHALHERNGQPDPIFIINSGKVLDNLADMFRETMSSTYMKDFVQPRDGCGAHRTLFNHYLSLNNVNNQSAASEKALTMISYNGEGRHWNFDKYVTAQKKHHQVLEGLVHYLDKSLAIQCCALILMDWLCYTKILSTSLKVPVPLVPLPCLEMFRRQVLRKEIQSTLDITVWPNMQS